MTALIITVGVMWYSAGLHYASLWFFTRDRWKNMTGFFPGGTHYRGPRDLLAIGLYLILATFGPINLLGRNHWLPFKF